MCVCVIFVEGKRKGGKGRGRGREPHYLYKGLEKEEEGRASEKS